MTVTRRFLGLLLAGSLLLIHASALSWAADSVTVEGDDDRDGFLSSGSLLLDDTFSGDDATRRSVSQCPGCRWTTIPTCVSEDTSCLPGLSGCPSGTVRATVWLSRPGEPLAAIGRVCVGPGGPRTVESVSEEIRDAVFSAVPPLRPSIAPRPALLGLPVQARTGQTGSLGQRTLTLSGSQVVLDATATWTWEWGDGARLSTSTSTARHTYRSTGVHSAAVTAVWQAWFTVDDLGPFAATGARVTQVAPVSVNVRRARALLVRP